MNIFSDVIQWCMLNLPPIKDIGFTKPPMAMPEEYKVKRLRIVIQKLLCWGFSTWKNRDTPDWFLNQK